MYPHNPTFISQFIVSVVIKKMWDDEGNIIESAPHPQQKVRIKMDKPVGKYDILRRESKEYE